ncbi:ornithine carbamoyltransferase [Salirhabdus euzebyi]|uniref:Ornithine carbamoyltransferase n=1 Tax=Salirhabdus euzebyi TaxID=394506 RepID=A0A841Q2Y0_9BACI|nr:ornithine carbamoyltransferase [Salirhabdus euzebyi]MBB6451878.1 ornithine carbamoyltransferase [Salirhabdus euzebyi]
MENAKTVNQEHSLSRRNLLTLEDFSKEEIYSLLELADYLKQQRKLGKQIQPLKGKVLGLIFEKASTRTRVSFESGMYQLGGTALFLSKNDLQMGRGEPISDTAKVLSGYLDGIMIRTFSHSTVEELAKHATIPIINGLTDLYHPCQVLADLQTIREKKGTLQNLKVAYIGDGNNMAHSLLIGCAKMGMNISIATPVGYEPNQMITDKAKEIGKQQEIILTNNPYEAVKDADIIYTDVWASMGQEEEQWKREKDFQLFQVDEKLLKSGKSTTLFMHCLPAHRGEEVAANVIDGPHSIVYQQAENRLHVQKALLTAILG